MEIFCIEKIPSTHAYMCEAVRKGEIKEACAIYALEQSAGLGSRENEWQSSKGNLHLNFCLNLSELPSDLNLSSTSIYFSFILKELLAAKGSALWLKWPNDFYLGDKKIGGVISAKIKDFIIVGVGLNLISAPFNAGVLDIRLDLAGLVKEYVKEIQKRILWKQIFSKYMLEFEKSKTYSVHYEGVKVPLNEALLYEDGSILLQNKRIYSLR